MTESLDLGTFDEPVLVFGGPYSNLEAMEALMGMARSHDIPPERMLCTGDVVAYCADPQATVDLIRAAGIAVVMGNCEQSLGNNAADCDCGFAKGSACDLWAREWFTFAGKALDDKAKAWMGALPPRIGLTLAGRRLVVIYGGVAQTNRFVFPSTSKREKLDECNAVNADGVIAGHSGLPFTQIIEGCLWHNAGAIGLPANDGTPRVWYSVLKPESGGIAIEHRALDYDYRCAMSKMKKADCPVRTSKAYTRVYGRPTTSCRSKSAHEAVGRSQSKSSSGPTKLKNSCMPQHD